MSKLFVICNNLFLGDLFLKKKKVVSLGGRTAQRLLDGLWHAVAWP
jgi:hypothetical protein